MKIYINQLSSRHTDIIVRTTGNDHSDGDSVGSTCENPMSHSSSYRERRQQHNKMMLITQ